MGKVTVRRLDVEWEYTPEERARELHLKVFLKCKRNPVTGCMEWQRYKNDKGYGAPIFERRHWQANRLAYVLAIGPIPPDLFVLHRCDNPACCEPTHLFLGDNLTNILDMRAKKRDVWSTKKECKRGHPHTPETMYVDKFNKRLCRICERIDNRRKYALRKARLAAGSSRQIGGVE
jgi:hypothetical protein